MEHLPIVDTLHSDAASLDPNSSFVADLLAGEKQPVFQRESKTRFGGRSFLSRVENAVDSGLLATWLAQQAADRKRVAEGEPSRLAESLSYWKLQIEAELSTEVSEVVAVHMKEHIDPMLWKPTALDHRATVKIFFRAKDGKMYCWSYSGTRNGLAKFGTGKDKRLSYPRARNL